MKRPPLFRAAALLAACAMTIAAGAAQSQKGTSMSFELTSTAFTQGKPIPAKYTCDGQNISPPLQWHMPPQNARSFALIMDDPDAPGGTWVHWVLYNLPATAHALAEGFPAQASLADGSRNGTNSWPRLGYGGPCPPGGTHHYFFKLYALDRMIELAPGAAKEQLLSAMQGHILGQAELMGTYSRR